MVNWFTSNLLWSEGGPIFFGLVLIGLVGAFFYRKVMYLACALLLFSFYFFRNPERVCPQAHHDTSIIVSPADGKIVDVQFDENNGFDGYAQKVSIFLSPVDVHVNWTPTAGTINDVTYKRGKFMMAFLPKSSELNERNDITITRDDGKHLKVRQIAGTIARKIRCWVCKEQRVTVGQKYGMIKFGSRVDVLLPADAKLEIGEGQKVYGGQTILGRW